MYINYYGNIFGFFFILVYISFELEWFLMKPDISDLSVEDLKRLQVEAEKKSQQKKIKQLKMLIMKLLQ